METKNYFMAGIDGHTIKDGFIDRVKTAIAKCAITEAWKISYTRC